MTTKIVSRITIAASPKEVFKYMGDSSYHFLWNPHLHALEPAGPLKLGSRYKTSHVLLGIRTSSRNQVTVFVQDQELQIENHTGILTYVVNYKLQRAGKGTTVVCTTEVTTKGSGFAFSKPILKVLAQRELQSDLKSLKIAVEHKLD